MTKLSRKNFLKCSLGIGASLLVPGQIWKAGLAFAEDSKEEKKKEKLAKYVFNYSSPYITSDYTTTPHAHQEIKQLIEKNTKNKIYVKIHDGGSMGIGTALSNSVKYGRSQGALISVSNLTPMVNEFDILNIPFWSSNEKEYTRLFNSDIWEKYVMSKTKKYNLQILFPYVVGARTATTTKKYGKTIKAPEDFEGIKFRIPGSKSLKVFYNLTKAKPQTIAWKLCAKTARKGRYEALDPSVCGLYSGPDGLRHELGVISEIESVHDGWVAIGNVKYIESLDQETQKGFLSAFEEIQEKQLKLYQSAKNYAANEFVKLNTKIYIPTPKEKEILAKTFGHTNPAWIPVKKKLLGENGVAVFDELFKVAKG